MFDARFDIAGLSILATFSILSCLRDILVNSAKSRAAKNTEVGRFVPYFKSGVRLQSSYHMFFFGGSMESEFCANLTYLSLLSGASKLMASLHIVILIHPSLNA